MVVLQILLIVASFGVLLIIETEKTLAGNAVNISGKNRFLASELLIHTINYIDQKPHYAEPLTVMSQINQNILLLENGGTITEITIPPISSNFVEDLIVLKQTNVEYNQLVMKVIKSVDEGSPVTNSEIIEIEEKSRQMITLSDYLTKHLGERIEQLSNNSITIQIILVFINSIIHILLIYVIIKILRKQYKEIQEQKNRFTSMISHELKTPLTSIKGYTEILTEPEIAESFSNEQITYIKQIQKSSQILGRLIDKFLDIQKLEMCDMKFEKKNFETEHIISNLKKEIEPIIKDEDIKITIADHAKCEIFSDESKLFQALFSVVKNAIEFTSKKNGIVEVYSKQDKDKVIFSIKDNGKGISKQDQEKILGKFSQVDTSETRMHGGVGLELAISLGIVKALGGNIQVESDGEGKGSVFYISIPKN